MYTFDSNIIDDVKQLERKNAFENLYIYLTNICNYKCKHCYLGDRLFQREDMPLEMVYHHLESWRSLGSNKVCFIGGEPTLYPYLSNAVNKAYDLRYQTIIIGSNGSKNAKKVFQGLDLKKISYFQISLDGATELTHDHIRSKGAFLQALITIRYLVSAGADVRIIMTVNTFNINEVIPMIQLGEELGVSLVKFHIMSEIGNVHASRLQAVAPLDWIKCCNEIYNYAAKGNFHTRISFQPTYGHNCIDFPISSYQGCVGKKLERISVFPNGKCYICSFLFDYDVYYAELKNGIISKNQHSEYDMFSESNKICTECSSCCGYDGCVAEIITNRQMSCTAYNNLFPLCRLWKVEIEAKS